MSPDSHMKCCLITFEILLIVYSHWFKVAGSPFFYRKGISSLGLHPFITTPSCFAASVCLIFFSYLYVVQTQIFQHPENIITVALRQKYVTYKNARPNNNQLITYHLPVRYFLKNTTIPWEYYLQYSVNTTYNKNTTHPYFVVLFFFFQNVDSP